MDKRTRELIEKEQAIKELYQFISDQVIAGLFKNDIIDKVIELGYDRYTAADLVDEMEERMQRIQKKRILMIMPPTPRKDLVWDFDDEGRPVEPLEENARTVAEKLAESIVTYLKEDQDD